jgi:hypothetical protein
MILPPLTRIPSGSGKKGYYPFILKASVVILFYLMVFRAGTGVKSGGAVR